MIKNDISIVNKPVNDLIPYINNARVHSDDQINQIAASIKEFGFTNPVLIDGENGIIAGHGRVLASKKLNIDIVPTIELSHLTETQKKAYILADNKLALNAGWDDDLLSLELLNLRELDFDLDLIGFGEDELDQIIQSSVERQEGKTDPDDVPEVTEKPKTRRGDVWLLGNHRLMCGDATFIDDIDKLMNGNKAGMVFTDPPYGIGLDKDGQKLGKSQPYKAVLNDHNTDVAIDAFGLAASICSGCVFFWGANYYSQALPGGPCWIVWDKQGGKHVTYADVELCYSNITAPSRMFTHIWDGFRRDSEKNEKRVHPTQKPVKLIEDIWLFFDSFIADGLVLDMFGGSGSTLIACEKTNRVCYMMELDTHYCDVILNRWQNFTDKEAILESTGEKYNSIQS